MSKIGCKFFIDGLRDLVDKMRKDYHMTYAEIVGCLDLVKADMILESQELDKQQDDEEEEWGEIY